MNGVVLSRDSGRGGMKSRMDVIRGDLLLIQGSVSQDGWMNPLNLALPTYRFSFLHA